MFVLEFLSLVYWYFAELFPILLVTNKNDNNFRFTLSHHLLKPLFQVQKCIQTRNVICQNHAMSSFVENLSDRFERLLACCIPNLKFEDLLLKLYHQRTEFHSYCHLMIFLELICSHSVHETTFSYCRIADNDELK